MDKGKISKESNDAPSAKESKDNRAWPEKREKTETEDKSSYDRDPKSIKDIRQKYEDPGLQKTKESEKGSRSMLSPTRSPFQLSQLGEDDTRYSNSALEELRPTSAVRKIAANDPTEKEIEALFVSALKSKIPDGPISAVKVTQLVLDIHYLLKRLPSELLNDSATEAAQELCERALKAYIKEGDHRLLKSGEWYENKVNDALKEDS